MKTIIATALLLVFASPAFAAGSDAEWTCPDGIHVTSGKGQISAYFEILPYAPKVELSGKETHKRLKGSRNLKLEWNFREGAKVKIRMNGKACAQEQ